MVTFAREKRTKGRVKRELVVKVKVGQETKQVYMIDISPGGMKVGGVLLKLTIGEQVEVSIIQGSETITFAGIVRRQDGTYHINRIGREGKTFFIQISDTRFSEFVNGKFPT